MKFKYLLHREVEESNKDCDSDTQTPYQIKVMMKPLGLLPQYRKTVCHMSPRFMSRYEHMP